MDFSERAEATLGGATRVGSIKAGEEMLGGINRERLRRHLNKYMLGRFRDKHGRELYKPPIN